MERLTNCQGLLIKCIDCIERSNCEAECDAINFCKLMDSHNMKWFYGDKYTDYNYWDVDVL